MTARHRLAAALAAPFLLVIAGCATRPSPTTQPNPRPAPAAPAPPRPGTPPGAAPVDERLLPGSIRDFVVSVGDRVYFDVDGFEVQPEGAARLAEQAQWLNRYPAVQVRIEGNCDERGTREYNLALGARRAQSVKAFLVAHGVAPDRIATVSFGKERPIDGGEGEAAWSHNRNAHTVVVAGAR